MACGVFPSSLPLLQLQKYQDNPRTWQMESSASGKQKEDGTVSLSFFPEPHTLHPSPHHPAKPLPVMAQDEHQIDI